MSDNAHPEDPNGAHLEKQHGINSLVWARPVNAVT